jgi:hypothetical protein
MKKSGVLAANAEKVKGALNVIGAFAEGVARPRALALIRPMRHAKEP